MERRKKLLLLIAENDVRAADIRNLLAGDDLEIVDVPDLMAAARPVLRSRGAWTAIVLDWVLPESAGIEFIERIQASSSSAGSAGGRLRHPHA